MYTISELSNEKKLEDLKKIQSELKLERSSLHERLDEYENLVRHVPRNPEYDELLSESIVLDLKLLKVAEEVKRAKEDGRITDAAYLQRGQFHPRQSAHIGWILLFLPLMMAFFVFVFSFGMVAETKTELVTRYKALSSATQRGVLICLAMLVIALLTRLSSF